MKKEDLKTCHVIEYENNYLMVIKGRDGIDYCISQGGYCLSIHEVDWFKVKSVTDPVESNFPKRFFTEDFKHIPFTIVYQQYHTILIDDKKIELNEEDYNDYKEYFKNKT